MCWRVTLLGSTQTSALEQGVMPLLPAPLAYGSSFVSEVLTGSGMSLLQVSDIFGRLVICAAHRLLVALHRHLVTIQHVILEPTASLLSPPCLRGDGSIEWPKEPHPGIRVLNIQRVHVVSGSCLGKKTRGPLCRSTMNGADAAGACIRSFLAVVELSARAAEIPDLLMGGAATAEAELRVFCSRPSHPPRKQECWLSHEQCWMSLRVQLASSYMATAYLHLQHQVLIPQMDALPLYCLPQGRIV